MHYLNFDWGGEQSGTPLSPWMCPCWTAAGHMGCLVKEAVESPGEHEKYEHINGFTLI